jgi:hypothetical protein
MEFPGEENIAQPLSEKEAINRETRKPERENRFIEGGLRKLGKLIKLGAHVYWPARPSPRERLLRGEISAGSTIVLNFLLLILRKSTNKHSK